MEGQYELELRRMIAGRFNHPSIILWVTFNEGWGLSFRKKSSSHDKDSPSDESIARQKQMVAAAKEEDPTRLMDAESGTGGGKGGNPENFWDIGLGDWSIFTATAAKSLRSRPSSSAPPSSASMATAFLPPAQSHRISRPNPWSWD